MKPQVMTSDYQKTFKKIMECCTNQKVVFLDKKHFLC